MCNHLFRFLRIVNLFFIFIFLETHAYSYVVFVSFQKARETRERQGNERWKRSTLRWFLLYTQCDHGLKCRTSSLADHYLLPHILTNTHTHSRTYTPYSPNLIALFVCVCALAEKNLGHQTVICIGIYQMPSDLWWLWAQNQGPHCNKAATLNTN